MPKKFDPINKIDRLYHRGLLVLGREMERLVQLSNRDKLSFTNSKDLRDYVKLLGDMKKAHKDIKAERAATTEQSAKTLSDKELENAIKTDSKG